MASTTQVTKPIGIAFLTNVQKECLHYGGNCEACPTQRFMSEPCQVKYSEGVADKLLLPVKRRSDSKRHRPKLDFDNCRCCMNVYAPLRKTQKNCQTCIDKYGPTAIRISCVNCARVEIVPSPNRTRCTTCSRSKNRFR